MVLADRDPRGVFEERVVLGVPVVDHRAGRAEPEPLRHHREQEEEGPARPWVRRHVSQRAHHTSSPRNHRLNSSGEGGTEEQCLEGCRSSASVRASRRRRPAPRSRSTPRASRRTSAPSRSRARGSRRPATRDLRELHRSHRRIFRSRDVTSRYAWWAISGVIGWILGVSLAGRCPVARVRSRGPRRPRKRTFARTSFTASGYAVAVGPGRPASCAGFFFGSVLWPLPLVVLPLDFKRSSAISAARSVFSQENSARPK